MCVATVKLLNGTQVSERDIYSPFIPVTSLLARLSRETLEEDSGFTVLSGLCEAQPHLPLVIKFISGVKTSLTLLALVVENLKQMEYQERWVDSTKDKLRD